MHKLVSRLGLGAAVLTVAVVGGCGGSPQGGEKSVGAGAPSSEGASAAPQEQKFHRTVVVFLEDGSKVVRESWITREEQLAEQAARTADTRPLAAGVYETDALTNDNCSYGNDVVLWDGVYGTGNEICFRNTSSTKAQSADLGNFVETSYYCGTGYYYQYWFSAVCQTVGFTCSCASATNNIASIDGGGSAPIGCFNSSGTTTNDVGYWNFTPKNNAYETGTSIVNDEFLWLDKSGVYTGSLCTWIP